MNLVSSINDYYLVQETIGVGSQSETKKAICKETGQKVAIQIYHLPLENRQSLYDVIEMRRDLDHPCICRLLEVLETESDLFIVTEFVVGINLLQYIATNGKIIEPDLSNLIHSLVDALNYLHERGIMVLNLSPEHLFITSDYDSNVILKIMNFSCAQNSTGQNVADSGISPYFSSPEVILCSNCTTKSDMWSLGAIVYLLACGYPPFFEKKDSVLLVKTLNGDYKFNSPAWNGSSDTAQNFIRNTLTANPDDRLSAQEARTHVFLNQNSQSDVGSDETITNEDLQATPKEYPFLKVPIVKEPTGLKAKYLKVLAPFLRCRKCKN
ncbi:hypothetical protein HK103_001243 [Boothiomyces macroporosus]|uniref:Protein kinase domain-containing protein n=1 Tax=Boothiomyces macroporosus TaxID=261099 RepID=A0AAD5Y790_9FUNG|nr:hypothetical protein HK103_001243 [Boothiomyces macroporosus]